MILTDTGTRTSAKAQPLHRIEISLFDLKYDKMKERLQFFIELYPTHIIVETEAYLDRYPTPQNKEDGKYDTVEDFYMRESDFIIKSAIDTVESYFNVEDEIWVCQLHFNGRVSSFRFQTEKEMRSLESILRNYIIS